MRRQFDVYVSRGEREARPIVVFANGAGSGLRQWRSYIEWARLVTERRLAAVLYEGPAFDPSRTPAENLRASVADLDSLLVTLSRLQATLTIDASSVVIWAGSGQAATGTPVALEGARAGVRGLVLYYGTGAVTKPRLDVPVFVVRAGLDSPALNRSLDSLTREWIDAGMPVTLVNHAAGRHGFDVTDSSVVTALLIAQTLDFAAAVTEPRFVRALHAGVPDARAAAAYSAGRWEDAEQLYGELQRRQPANATTAWRLGLAQLENGKPAGALRSFTRARELGMGGARDLGIPAARAAVRARDTVRAAEWVRWALRAFPPIRQQIVADHELGPLLEHPLVRGGRMITRKAVRSGTRTCP